MKKVKAAVFASGSGSNFQALVDHADLPCGIELLVCDKADAPVIAKAKAKGIMVHVFNPKNYQSRKQYELQMVNKLQRFGIEWIILAGYMRLVGPILLTAFQGKILNIHPSLLPEFPGLDAIGQALTAGVSETGVTVHYVDEGMDTGPIIMQEVVPIKADDTKASLTERVHQVEHRLYIEAIRQVMKGDQS